MIASFIDRLRPPKWPKPGEVKNFAWSPAVTAAFAHWSHHKNAQMDDLPLPWLLQGTMLGADLWNSVDHWWRRWPMQFGMFWAIIQKSPRQKWSQAALHTLAKHVPVDEVELLVQSALLCDDGRAWMLSSPNYAPYLRNINAEQMQQWVRSTTYSMPSLFETFDSLVMLHGYIQDSHKNLVAEILAWHYHEQEKLEPTSNVAKAWVLSTVDLDKWMDEDKQLPFWFDPVNRASWVAQCRNWADKTGYVVDDESPLFSIL